MHIKGPVHIPIHTHKYVKILYPKHILDIILLVYVLLICLSKFVYFALSFSTVFILKCYHEIRQPSFFWRGSFSSVLNFACICFVLVINKFLEINSTIFLCSIFVFVLLKLCFIYSNFRCTKFYLIIAMEIAAKYTVFRTINSFSVWSKMKGWWFIFVNQSKGVSHLSLVARSVVLLVYFM